METEASFTTLEWVRDTGGHRLRLLDQTRLPAEETYIDIVAIPELCDAIRRLVVRGAPAIGCAAAFGLAMVAERSQARTKAELLVELEQARETLAATRPTAVNLFWALDRMMRRAADAADAPVEALAALLSKEATLILAEDLVSCMAIGDHGAALLPDEANVLTHCNAGGLATAGYGTALGVIRAAHEAGKRIHVWVDETRPLLQGARLTAWELARERIPCTVICDNMAGALMRAGRVDCVVVGADRIAANGDVANKTGTYALACLAKMHNIPFYVAAPLSTVDTRIPSGDRIPIEQRDGAEVCQLGERQLCPAGVAVYNPAFDVTPSELITAIITEQGLLDF